MRNIQLADKLSRDLHDPGDNVKYVVIISHVTDSTE